jgi:hypothetical protein
MRSRITILKEIMAVEREFANESINSEEFEKQIHVLENELAKAPKPSHLEMRKAFEKREVPYTVHQLVSSFSVEKLVSQYENISRSYFRRLKIKREALELQRTIYELKKSLQKIRVLKAENKINQKSAREKMNNLEYELRLAENRHGARKKYLKRNPIKGEILAFTLKNYIQFSFGYGIENEQELKEVIQGLQQEIKIRKKLHEIFVDILAKFKASQSDISSSKEQCLPDFRQMREIQRSINEVKSYLDIINKELSELENVLLLVNDEVESLDDESSFTSAVNFGIAINQANESKVNQSETEIISQSDEELSKNEFAAMLTELEILEENNSDDYYLLQSTDSKTPQEKDSLDLSNLTEEQLILPQRRGKEESAIQSKTSNQESQITIPQSSYPNFEPTINIEIEGVEEIEHPFRIETKNEDYLTSKNEQIIYESFEGMLEQLIDNEKDEEEKIKTTKTKKPRKVSFTSLSDDLKKVTKTAAKVAKESKDHPTLDNEIETLPAKREITTIKEIEPLDPSELRSLEEQIIASQQSKTSVKETKIMIEETKAAKSEAPKVPPISIPEETPIPEKEIPREPAEREEAKALPKKEEIITKEEKIVEKEPVKEKIDKPMFPEQLFNASTEAWKHCGKSIFSLEEDGSRNFLGYLREVVIFQKNRIGYTIVEESKGNQEIFDEIFKQIKPIWVSEELSTDSNKRKQFVLEEIKAALNVETELASYLSRILEFINYRNIDFPEHLQTVKPEVLGIIPIGNIRIKGGAIYCHEEQILPNQKSHIGPWKGKYDDMPVLKQLPCYTSYGEKLGVIIGTINHPVFGKLLLIDTQKPNNQLLSYFERRLDIQETNPKERLWLVKYLISKQLNLPEGEALKPTTLVNYSLQRGFPILPNEILNSFRILVSMGTIDEINTKKVTLRTASRIINPYEVFPFTCMHVKSVTGRHLGLCLGVSLSNNPAILISEQISRKIVSLFTDKKQEKEAMAEISQTVKGTLGVSLQESLCSHNILKTLIVSRKIQNLEDYSKYLSWMAVNGLSLSKIVRIEKGLIYIKEDYSH